MKLKFYIRFAVFFIQVSFNHSTQVFDLPTVYIILWPMRIPQFVHEMRSNAFDFKKMKRFVFESYYVQFPPLFLIISVYYGETSRFQESTGDFLAGIPFRSLIDHDIHKVNSCDELRAYIL